MRKMNLRRTGYLVALVLIGPGSPGIAGDRNANDPGSSENSGPSYTINYSKSTLYWEGAKPGGTHQGTIEIINGAAQTDGNSISGGSFEIDMSTIRNDDIGNEGMRDKLLGHLKSEDFFYVDKYPRAVFEITGVEAGDGASHTITGDLTIRGNTNEISFAADIAMDDEMIHAKTGEIVLDRTKWEVNHMSKSVFAEMKDRFINDEMIVKLDLHFSRN